MSASGPGCVKTCTSRGCAELFSLFSSFDGDCQSGSFVIQRNRDKLSTRKFDVGVFTQAGSKGEMLAASRCFPLFPQQRTSLNRVGMSVRCQQETHAPQQKASYSITSSARASSAGGTARLTSSTLVDCFTGRSAGFSPGKAFDLTQPYRVTNEGKHKSVW
jgi:hypothetical protein